MQQHNKNPTANQGVATSGVDNSNQLWLRLAIVVMMVKGFFPVTINRTPDTAYSAKEHMTLINSVRIVPYASPH